MGGHPSRRTLSEERLVECLAGGVRRALVVGVLDADVSSLLARVADELEGRDSRVTVLSTSLGSPVFGPPGAVSRGRRLGSRWIVDGLEALCTLDAARFRLPLVMAARRLLEDDPRGILIVAAPAVHRGAAAGELREAFAEGLSLEAEYVVASEPRARSGRQRRRDDLWQRHLTGAVETTLPLDGLEVRGSPPPVEIADAWPGRQVALLDARGRTRAFGEAIRLEGEVLSLDAPAFDAEGVRAVIARDARRIDGVLRTERRPADGPAVVAADLDARPGGAPLVPPVVSLASAKAFLVNGVFGDSLLHVRVRHHRRSLLFDLGEAARLQGRIVHQVSDVFITHAHFDHIGGFPGFLRTSIGSPELRRLWGPPGLAEHVEGTVSGIRWDRIGERGPRFEVSELHGDELRRFRIHVGRGTAQTLERVACPEGVLLDEPGFRVRAVALDHGIPVLAFSFEEARSLNVRREALEASGLAPGPWLSELKEKVLEGRADEAILLPDGGSRSVAELERELLLGRAGQKLVYATDFDDTESNRRALVSLASGAHVLYCEASFANEDASLARATQHLTASACGEIAAAAGVAKLVPFHFSKRYDSEPSRIYRQVAAAFPHVVVARPAVSARYQEHERET